MCMCYIHVAQLHVCKNTCIYSRNLEGELECCSDPVCLPEPFQLSYCLPFKTFVGCFKNIAFIPLKLISNSLLYGLKFSNYEFYAECSWKKKYIYTL